MGDTKKIGFIGLGVMGGPMALNMLKKGSEEVIVYDISAELMKKYTEQGLTAAASYADISKCDVIFLSLPDGEIVKKVLFSPGGVYDNLKTGQIVVDLSTIKYSTTIEIDKKLKEKGVKFLDAPVSGMAARAVDGDLAIMCGGEEDVFDKIRPFFDRVGTSVVYMGKIGSGQLMKLINQLLFNINVAGMAEILPFALKMGLDPEKTVAIVNSGTGRSFASEFFAPRALQSNFQDGYPLEDAYKDMQSASEISASHNLPLPVLNAATITYQMALLKGHGKQNKGSMIHVYEDLFNVEFRAPKKKD